MIAQIVELKNAQLLICIFSLLSSKLKKNAISITTKNIAKKDKIKSPKNLNHSESIEQRNMYHPDNISLSNLYFFTLSLLYADTTM